MTGSENGEGQGWHNDPVEHNLARQGVSTRPKNRKTKPLITEQQAEEIVAQMKGISPSHESALKAQEKPWYEEHWLEGRALPDDRLEALDIPDLQQIRTEVEKHLEKITDAYEHREFYERERDRIKSKIGDKLRKQMQNLEKDLHMLNQ